MGFALGGLSAAALRACVGKAKRRSKAALTHIKPQHLGGPLASLSTPAALADALAAAGFNTVIVIERQNHLARLVSSFENRVREWRAATDDEFAGRAKPRVARRAAAFFAGSFFLTLNPPPGVHAGADAVSFFLSGFLGLAASACAAAAALRPEAPLTIACTLPAASARAAGSTALRWRARRRAW